MHERTVVIPEGVGLHARPASRFVEAATAVAGAVTIEKAGGTGAVDAKSILSVLGLDVRGGDRVVVRVDGEDGERDADRLAAVLESGDDDA